MYLPEVPLSEIETLQCLRGFRAERAERQLRKALAAQQALSVRIEQARVQVEQNRLQEARQRAELLGRHRGRAVSLQTLTGWGEAERKACAETVREEQRLQLLFDQQRREVIDVERARKHASQCRRAVEKLRELSVLWGQKGL